MSRERKGQTSTRQRVPVLDKPGLSLWTPRTEGGVAKSVIVSRHTKSNIYKIHKERTKRRNHLKLRYLGYKKVKGTRI